MNWWWWTLSYLYVHYSDRINNEWMNELIKVLSVVLHPQSRLSILHSESIHRCWLLWLGIQCTIFGISLFFRPAFSHRSFSPSLSIEFVHTPSTFNAAVAWAKYKTEKYFFSLTIDPYQQIIRKHHPVFLANSRTKHFIQAWNTIHLILACTNRSEWFKVQMLFHIVDGRKWSYISDATGLFPKVTLCDFLVRKVGNSVLYTVQVTLWFLHAPRRRKEQ